MVDWRMQMLKEFTPEVARLTLVADPDDLLVEEGVLQGIRERGFELIPFEDHVAFRYAYESRFRSRWDRGEHTDLVVVLRSPSSEWNRLPFDLLQAGRKLSFSLAEIFPNLSYPVVAALDRGDLDALFQAQQQHNPGKLGDNATKDFALRHVFGVAPELVKQPSDLLRVLLRRHYRNQRIPRILDERFIQILRQSGLFGEWPLERIVPDRQAFLAFLQERWPAFLDRLAAADATMVREAATPYGLVFDGPVDLPFNHDDVRVYIDNLFTDGLLDPVFHEQRERLAGKWVAVGIRVDPQADRLRRLDGLIKSVQDSLPSPGSRYHEWFPFAYRWAELTALWLDMGTALPEPAAERLQQLRREVDSVFLGWVQIRYAGLHNQPALPPAMVHHVPRALARRREEDEGGRVALVLLDGLALDQWIVLREVLKGQLPGLRFQESAVFAWLPTITSVSRQAAFAGKPPLYFPASIYTTDRESSLWHQFWADHGLTPKEVGYLKGLGDGDLEAVSELAVHPSMRALGLVVDKVDRIMHGMELGAAGMHNQVRQWATGGYLSRLVEILIGNEYQIVLASDHGNIEASGCGSPAEGALADLRGERVRLYPDAGLRAGVKARFPEAIEWPAIGLPDDFLPLLAPQRLAFIPEGSRTVAHGGITIEELVVPLIYMRKEAS